MKKASREAFTLIELLVVVAIIGILAALLFPAFSYARQVAKKTRAKAEVKQLDIAFRAVQNDYRRFSDTPLALPAGGGDVNSSVVGFLRGGDTRGTIYMEFDASSTNSSGAFVDPWGGVYQAALGTAGQITPPHGTFYREIGAWSKGKDGSSGSAAGDAQQKDDVTSWMQ